MDAVIRLLTPEDYEQVFDIIDSQPKIYEILKTKNDIEEVLRNPRAVRYGAFRDGELRSTIAMIPWQTGLPYAMLSTMVQRPTTTFNPHENHLIQVLQAAMDHGEQNEIYTFYSIRGLREFKLQTQRYIWGGWPDDKYVGFTEAYVPANTVPQNPGHAQMMRNKPLPYDAIIRCQKLKNSFRFPNEPKRLNQR